VYWYGEWFVVRPYAVYDGFFCAVLYGRIRILYGTVIRAITAVYRTRALLLPTQYSVVCRVRTVRNT